MLNKELIEKTAKLKGLTNKEHIEKDYFQELFLFELYKRTNALAFKGGTALYKLYKLPRFSEDLDFSLIDKNVDIEKVLKETAESLEGFSVKESKKTAGALLTKISIKGRLTKYNTIRIDISLDNPIIKGFEIKNYASDYVDVNPFSLRALSLAEILAEKVHAVFAREKARDLFDLFFLVKIAKIDRELIDEKLKPLNEKFDIKNFEKRISRYENVWEGELKPFILGELPAFKEVKEYVAGKFKVNV